MFASRIMITVFGVIFVRRESKYSERQNLYPSLVVLEDNSPEIPAPATESSERLFHTTCNKIPQSNFEVLSLDGTLPIFME